MATVRILNAWKNPGWKGGELVEMTGDTLKEWLAASMVEVVEPDLELEKEVSSAVEEVKKTYGSKNKKL